MTRPPISRPTEISGSRRRWCHWIPLVAAALLCAVAHSPASAFTYARIGDGSSQYMAWLWEWNPPVTSCLNAFPPSPCGNVFSTDGRIAMNFHSDSRTVSGGSLDWSLQPGTLKVVALTRVGANATSTAGSYAGAWASIDARSTRLDFVIQAQAGDPPVVDLGIAPELVGTVTQMARVLGSQADVQFEMMMSVEVNGQVVSLDSLYATYALSGPDTITYSPALPHHPANHVVVPAVYSGSEISIGIWAYMRAMTSGLTSVFASSPYGSGPALVVTVQAANVVAVPEGGAAERLRLGARPNPAPGSSTISYTLPRASGVRLSLYDIAGHRVATLADRAEGAGSHELAWNGRDERGARVVPGIYFVELLAGAERTVAKLVVLGR